ncbi:hypothetical protein RAA17_12005 [Komagataeibacter rhaeticus]|nr:hypothetical protein [Komagataeibacter rhaeticus]
MDQTYDFIAAGRCALSPSILPNFVIGTVKCRTESNGEVVPFHFIYFHATNSIPHLFNAPPHLRALQFTPALDGFVDVALCLAVGIRQVLLPTYSRAPR